MKIKRRSLSSDAQELSPRPTRSLARSPPSFASPSCPVQSVPSFLAKRNTSFHTYCIGSARLARATFRFFPSPFLNIVSLSLSDGSRGRGAAELFGTPCIYSRNTARWMFPSFRREKDRRTRTRARAFKDRRNDGGDQMLPLPPPLA